MESAGCSFIRLLTKGDNTLSAGSLSTWFSWAALVSTFATLFFSGLALHYRSISSKEKDLEVASIKLEAAKSNAEAAKAHERIAELSTEAEQLRKSRADAEVKLEQLRKSVRPRGFGMEFFDLVKDEPGCPVRISYVDTASDGASLATQLTFILPKERGWIVGVPEPITAREPFMASASQGFFRSPDFIAPENSMMGTGINPSGVSIVIGPGFEPPAAWRDLKTGATPVGALIRAFLASVGSVSYGFDSRLPSGSLRAVIGPRP